LVLAVVPGARSIENAEEIVREVHDRTAGDADVLLTSDEYSAYESAIEHVYGTPEEPKPPGTPGRPPVVPRYEIPAELNYATVHKERREGRVVSIVTAGWSWGHGKRCPVRWSGRGRAGGSTPRSSSGTT
jgi:hypothetical protein